jgi:hypothetical protein
VLDTALLLARQTPAWAVSSLTPAGFDAALLVQSGQPQDPYMTIIPPRHSGGATLISYRGSAERGPRNPQRRPSDQSHDHNVT